MDVIKSKNDVPIRLTGECIAVREVENGKNIVVVYRELSKEDGFVITAFLTRRKKQFEKRRKIWKQ